jgi:hypothetical protein
MLMLLPLAMIQSMTVRDAPRIAGIEPQAQPSRFSPSSFPRKQHSSTWHRRFGIKPLILEAGLTQRAGKSKIINKAMQDIGMGRYQWELFALCGFGWVADK